MMRFEDILKPKTDKKAYRLIRLDTGMKVLLVHTPSSQTTSDDENQTHEKSESPEELKAAAALAVEVGSYSDPSTLEGCAHFLEHMIFMGSHKYPKENEYDSFVSSHGGVCNAYTEGEYTVYHFDVNHGALPKALDIFANCILDPLLAPDAVDREIKAIQNEFKLAVLDDDSRLQQVLSHQVRPDHVLHKFSWGNEQSLRLLPAEAGVDSYATLKEFYTTYYQQRVHKMTLCVVGGYSLDEMEAMVTQKFDPSNISSGEVSSKPENTELKSSVDSTASWPVPSQLAIPESSCHTLTRMVSIKNTHRVVLTWQIPSVLTEYQTKPAQYLGHILGHECPGSLLARLKERQWASKLVAGIGGTNFEDNSLQAMFTVDIELTDIGLIHWIEVVALVNTTLQFMRNFCLTSDSDGLPKWIFDEMQCLAELTFDYMEEEEAEDVAERLAVQLLPLLGREDRDIIAAPYLFFHWSSAMLSKLLLDYMGIEQAKIIVMSRAFQSSDEDEADSDDGDDEEEDDDENDDNYSDEEDDEEDENEVDKEILTLERIREYYDVSTISDKEFPFLSYVVPPPPLSPLDEGNKSEITPVQDDLLVEEPYFHVKYWNKAISSELYTYWTQKAEIDALTEACFPPHNPFVPRDLALIETFSKDHQTGNVEPQSKRPRLTGTKDSAMTNCKTCPPVSVLPVIPDGKTWLYHCADGRFHVPKVEVFVEISCPPSVQLQLDTFSQLQKVSYSPEEALPPNSRQKKKTISASQLARDRLIEESVCRDIIVALSKDVLTSTAWYMAELAGLESEISSRPSSIIFSVRGFHDHALTLLCTSLEAIFNVSSGQVDQQDLLTDAARMKRIVNDLVRKKYVNALLTAQHVAQEGRLALLMTDDISSAERLTCLDRLLSSQGAGSANNEQHSSSNMDKLLSIVGEYRKSLCQLGEFHIMVHGNLPLDRSQTNISSLLSRIRNNFPNANNHIVPAKGKGTGSSKSKKGTNSANNTSSSSPPHPSTSTVPEKLLARVLPTNNVPLLFDYARSAVEENTAVEAYFQFPSILFSSLHDPSNFANSEMEDATFFTAWMALQLLELHWSEPFFDRLRSQLQLGYLVDCSLRETRNQLGLCLRIVSATHSAPQLLQHMLDDFVAKQLSELFPALPDVPPPASSQKGKKTPTESETNSSLDGVNFVATKLVENLLARKQQPDVSLGDASQRHWSLVEDRLLNWERFLSPAGTQPPRKKEIFDFSLREQQIAYLQDLLLLPSTSKDSSESAVYQREIRLRQHLQNVAEWLLLGDSHIKFSKSSTKTDRFVSLDTFLRTSLPSPTTAGTRLLISIAMPRPSLQDDDEDDEDDLSEGESSDAAGKGQSGKEKASETESDSDDEDHGDEEEGDEEEEDERDEEIRQKTLKECQDILRTAWANYMGPVSNSRNEDSGMDQEKTNLLKNNNSNKRRSGNKKSIGVASTRRKLVFTFI